MDLQGDPVAIEVGKGKIPLAGALAQSVRVTNSRGDQLLYRLDDPQGKLIEKGSIPKGSIMTIPLENGKGDKSTYMNYVTKQGKAEYNLPMFVNAWLEYPDSPNPGGFPSGGPLPRVMDVWKAGAPDVDFMCPDIYGENFVEWCDLYTAQGDPLFIPETWWTKPEYVAYMLYAIGNYNTLGVAPFGIDRLDPQEYQPLREMYRAVEYLTPEILKYQGDTSHMRAFLIDKSKPFIEFEMDNYYVKAELYMRRGEYKVEDAFGLGPVDEYVYRDENWQKGRRLGGDETNRGTGVFLPVEGLGIQKAVVYRYK